MTNETTNPKICPTFPISQNERDRDDEMFGPLQPASAIVSVCFQTQARSDGMRQDAFVARDGTTRRFSMIFAGHRADIFKDGLNTEINRRWTKACQEAQDAGKALPDTDSPALDVVVMGGWQRRRWKDSKGQFHQAWEFYPAQWAYRGLDGNVRQEGWHPNDDAWLAHPSAHINPQNIPA